LNFNKTNSHPRPLSQPLPPSLTGRGEKDVFELVWLSPSSPGVGGGRGREKRVGVMRVRAGYSDPLPFDSLTAAFSVLLSALLSDAPSDLLSDLVSEAPPPFLPP
jgi:hypothetical protein